MCSCGHDGGENVCSREASVSAPRMQPQLALKHPLSPDERRISQSCAAGVSAVQGYRIARKFCKKYKDIPKTNFTLTFFCYNLKKDEEIILIFLKLVESMAYQ